MAKQLSLLANAIGFPSYTKLSQIKGSNTLTKFSDYTVGEILGVTQDIQAGYDQNFDISFLFQNEGTEFYRIKNRPQNFTFNINNFQGAQLITNGGYYRRYKNLFNPKGVNCGVSILSSFPDSLSFYDQGFNSGIINYDFLLDTSVRLYAPPKPTFTITGTTAPPRPGVIVGGKYMGASITIAYDGGLLQGTAATSVNIYYSKVSNSIGTLAATVFNRVGTYRIGFDSSQTVNNYIIEGSTLYYITITNNFECQSNTSSVTTAAYV